MARKNTIVLKKYNDNYNEAFAADAILPGALVALDASGDWATSALTTAQSINVAIEDYLQGKTIEDAYAIGDPVKAGAFGAGEEALLIATGAIALGEQVEAAGDGTVQALASGVVIGVATRAAADGFVEVRFS